MREDAVLDLHDLLPRPSLRSFDGSSSGCVDIFLWQAQDLIQEAFATLQISIAIGIEDPGVHHFRKTKTIALFQLLNSSCVSFLAGLLSDFPVTLVLASYAEN